MKGGAPPENARRKKGTLNKITRDIRDGAIAGFARHGSNGRGEGGFAGYCFYLAKRHPKAAARLIEKLLPLTVNANATGFSGPTISTINVVSVPSGEYLSQEDIDRLNHQNDPHAIDHAPAQIEHHATPAPEIETPEDARLLAELNDLSDEELRERAVRCGLDLNSLSLSSNTSDD